MEPVEKWAILLSVPRQVFQYPSVSSLDLTLVIKDWCSQVKKHLGGQMGWEGDRGRDTTCLKYEARKAREATMSV